MLDEAGVAMTVRGETHCNRCCKPLSDMGNRYLVLDMTLNFPDLTIDEATSYKVLCDKCRESFFKWLGQEELDDSKQM